MGFVVKPSFNHHSFEWNEGTHTQFKSYETMVTCNLCLKFDRWTRKNWAIACGNISVRSSQNTVLLENKRNVWAMARGCIIELARKLEDAWPKGQSGEETLLKSLPSWWMFGYRRRLLQLSGSQSSFKRRASVLKNRSHDVRKSQWIQIATVGWRHCDSSNGPLSRRMRIESEFPDEQSRNVSERGGGFRMLLGLPQFFQCK